MVRRVLDQIGGTNAVTVWAWLVTLPVSVLISSTYSTAPSLRQAVSWTAALVLVHVGVGLVMLVARFTVLPGTPRRSRPFTALMVFALMGLVRAALLQVSQDVVGFGTFDFSERLTFNVAISMLVFSALAIVIGESREDARIMLRLTAARESLDELQQQTAKSLSDLDKKIVNEIESELALALADSSIGPEGLRRLSEDVVRTRSHELTRPSSVEQRRKPSRLRATNMILQRLQVPPPLLVLIPFQVAVFGFVAFRYSPIIALVGTFVGPLPSFLGLWLAREFLPLPRNGWLRLGTLAVTFAAIGSLATLAISWLFTTWFGAYEASMFAVGSGLMALSLLVATWIAVVEGRQSRMDHLADVIEQEAKEIQRTSRLMDDRRMNAARFLHGAIQNELVAASVRGDSPTEVGGNLRELFAAYSSAESPPTAEEAITGLLESWNYVLAISPNIDSCVWAPLVDNTERQALLVDAISEGLVNVVRHSSSKEVCLSLTCAGTAVVFQLASKGVPSHANHGIGLADLSARGAAVELSIQGDTTTLLVTV